MEGRINVYFVAVLVQFLLSGGQVMLKILAERLHMTGFSVLASSAMFWKVALPAAAVMLIYGLVIVLWLYVLQNMDVSKAFLFVSLTFLIVPIISYWFLGEEIKLSNFVGGALIIAGIVVGALL